MTKNSKTKIKALYNHSSEKTPSFSFSNFHWKNGQRASAENNDISKNDSGFSMPKTLACLFQKACRAKTCVIRAIQEEISYWYYYGKVYKERIKEIKNT
ncbi:hypothetical protein RhiirA4_471563 [Rhizophagus irregularis]|uniref:Uncharacterized protein n=1 Tax=Rhizophagus irregularis TaxID=588596 RepID=A0A2I1H3E4_9GLOM|nr:hypothetical protein RhiirA4_471563 [Rhizophagus irregularis]